ncbi:MAG: hypothetical protein R3F39_23365 [Myxococcota bacterium]
MPLFARYLLLALALGWAATSACDGGESAGASLDVSVDLTPDLALPDALPDTLTGADVGPTGPPSLDFATAVGDDGVACRGAGICAVLLEPGHSPRLEVVVSVGGVPVAERVVTFKIEDDEAGIGQISRLSTYSDPDGRAWVEVSAPGVSVGQFRVRAQLGTAEASPVTFDVIVTPDGRVPLTVRPSYDGELSLASVSVRAFAQSATGNPSCASPMGLLTTPPPAASVTGLELGRPARFLSLPATASGTTYTLLVTGENEAGLVVALGCDAQLAIVDSQKAVTVDVAMADRAPGFAGAFAATAALSLDSALSGPWADRSEAAFALLDGQPSALALLPCGLAAADAGLAELCFLLFNDPKAPHPDDTTLLGAAVVSAIAGHVDALRKGQPWGAALADGGSARDLLSGLEFRSTVNFLSEPSDDGVWKQAEANDSWDAVVARFSPLVPCPAESEPGCGKKKLFFATTQPETPVGGAFAATVTQSLELSIDSHETRLRYGSMLNAVLERALLPTMLGDGAGGVTVTRWEDLIALSLGGPGCLGKTGSEGCCGKFVGGLGALLTLQSATGVSTCEAWIAAGAASLRGPLLEAGAQGGGFAAFGTNAPCPAFDDDGDLVIDRLGSPDATCLFDLVIGDEAGTTVMSLDVQAARAP